MELASDQTISVKNIGERESESPTSFVHNFEILDLSKLDGNHFFHSIIPERHSTKPPYYREPILLNLKMNKSR